MTPGLHSSLDPAGPQAAAIAHLWWGYVVVSAVVLGVVLLAMALAVWRRRTRELAPAQPHAESPLLEAGVGTAVVFTTITLFVLLIWSIATGHRLSTLSDAHPLTITVVGHQWWWEVHYENEQPSLKVITANELHLPLHRVIVIKTESRDVIHSFWVPSLHGKRDVIPGHPSSYTLEVDRPGVFRGECAEFCGLEHAKMALMVVAEPDDAFERWLDAERRPAVEPTDDEALRGRALFESKPCMMCHTIRGTRAAATVAPDLTHFGSRLTIGAGTLPNTRGHLGGWILDSQSMKPGNNMPAINLSGDELNALIAYLEALK